MQDWKSIVTGWPNMDSYKSMVSLIKDLTYMYHYVHDIVIQAIQVNACQWLIKILIL